MPGAKAVVVEQEERRDQNRPVLKLESGVGVLRGEYAVAAGDLHEPFVERDAAKFGRRVGNRPEFVIARDPDDLAELRCELLKAPVEPLRAIGDVPRQNQPVVGKGRKALQRFPVRWMGDMQVRQRPQTHTLTVRDR